MRILERGGTFQDPFLVDARERRLERASIHVPPRIDRPAELDREPQAAADGTKGQHERVRPERKLGGAGRQHHRLAQKTGLAVARHVEREHHHLAAIEQGAQRPEGAGHLHDPPVDGRQPAAPVLDAQAPLAAVGRFEEPRVGGDVGGPAGIP